MTRFDGHEDARAWDRARSLADLGELTARWLEGAINYHPEYGGPRPDEETTHLVPFLARFNRAGFVTEDSQPGGRWERGHARAYVDGWCSEATADDAGLTTDLVIIQYPPGAASNMHLIPGGAFDGEGCLWLGYPPAPPTEDDYHPDAVAALRAAHAVLVFDPNWGRDDLLWPALDAALA